MKQRKPLILLDLDGILCDWSNEVTRLYLADHPNEKYPRIFSWAMYKAFEDQEYMKKRYLTNSDKGGYYDISLRNAKPYLGAHNFTVRLSSQADLKLVTARDEQYTDITIEWLDRYYFRNIFKEVILTHDKTKIEGDLLIDDKPENILSSIDTGKNGILFRRPWNREFKSINVFDVYSYEDILMYLQYNQQNFKFFY